MSAKFVVYKNAAGEWTAIPLNQLSRQEKKLLLEAGGKIVKKGRVPSGAVYPRGQG